MNPFGNSPDPRFLCMLPHTREALSCLEYGISARKGFLVLTGEVGTGKTTLLRRAINSVDKTVHTSFLFNPRLDLLDLLEFMMRDFGIEMENRSKSSMLFQINRWLIEKYAKGDTCILIVDEAQSLSVDMLEEIRLLTNLETDTQKLLQIILCGQPELEKKLRDPALRQLRQRIALWCRTEMLSEEQTSQYIATRLKIAGRDQELFLPETISAIRQHSFGIPRLINLLCDHALLLGYVDRSPRIDLDQVMLIISELEWELEQSEPQMHASSE